MCVDFHHRKVCVLTSIIVLISSSKSKAKKGKHRKMPLKLLDATVSNFESIFEKFISESTKNKANLILFLADKDPSTSLSWCPGIYYIFVSFPCQNLFFFNINFSLLRFMIKFELPIIELLESYILA